ncbi:MAG: hypothetical protein ABJG88_09705 [Litorimonas sp.]
MKSEKKSESLEVRLSHVDKQNLQAKAAREGRSVSHVVRSLISDYLHQPKPHPQLSFFTELLMKLKSKPKTVLATLACLPILAAPVFFSTPAMAENLSINLKGEFIKQLEDGNRVRSFNTEIHIQDGQFWQMRLPSIIAQGTETGLYMTVNVTENEDEVTLKLIICEIKDAPATGRNIVEVIPIGICDGENILSQPTLTTHHGDEVSFRMGNSSGETFKLSALPKKF